MCGEAFQSTYFANPCLHLEKIKYLLKRNDLQDLGKLQMFLVSLFNTISYCLTSAIEDLTRRLQGFLLVVFSSVFFKPSTSSVSRLSYKRRQT